MNVCSATTVCQDDLNVLTLFSRYCQLDGEGETDKETIEQSVNRIFAKLVELGYFESALRAQKQIL